MKFSALTEWLGLALWAITPLALSVLGVMLTVAPLQINAISIPMPLFALMVIYFWSMKRPALMSPLAIFLIGLFQDLLSGGPVGLWALTYLLALAMVSTQRRMFAKHNRSVLWLGFAMTALMAAGLSWSIARIALGAAPSGGRLGIELLITLLFWMPVARVLELVQRATNQARGLNVRSTMANF